MKYLVDTDWIIDHFRGDELITRKLEDIAPQFRKVGLRRRNPTFSSRGTRKTTFASISKDGVRDIQKQI